MPTDEILETPITVTVTLTFADYLRLNFWASFGRLRLALLLLTVLALLALVVYIANPWLPHEGKSEPANLYLHSLSVLILPGIIFVLIFVLPASAYFQARLRWRRACELRDPHTYSFSESGIQIKGPRSEGTMAWSLIASARRRGSLIWLATAQPLYYMIPVRAFADESQLQRFCHLVERKVSKSRLS